MTMDISGWFDTTITIKTVTRVKDDSGSWTESLADLYADVPAHKRKLSGRERQDVLGRIGKEATHRFYCNVQATALNATSHALVHGGTTYDIIDVDNPHDEGSFLQIDALLLS